MSVHEVHLVHRGAVMIVNKIIARIHSLLNVQGTSQLYIMRVQKCCDNENDEGRVHL